jgi:hypothetical protein
MNSEALLGPLPSGWKLAWGTSDGGHLFQMFKREDDPIQDEDPSLGPLPSPWYKWYNPESPSVTYYRHGNSDVAGWGDPRLTIVGLRRRGVDVQEIVLV